MWRLLLIEPRRPHSIRTSPRAHWYVVGAVSIGAFMGQLDASIVTLALPRLGHDLHASVGVVEWVSLSYLLVLVASVATIGRIADAVGRKLLYVYGFAVFTAGSVACGLAPTLAVLIGARVVQALGAAMLQANSVALIAEAMPGPLLGRGIGIQGTAQALGLALGPAVGGVLLALGGWRSVFLVNVPAGALGLVLGWFLLPRSRSRRVAVKADQLGAALLALGAAGPLVYFSLANRAGWGDPLLLASLVLGILAAIAFVAHERSVEEPLIELPVVRRPAISIGLSSGLVSYLVLFGVLFVVPYYLAAMHVGWATAGLRLAVLPLAIALAAPIAGRALSHVGERPLTSGGMLLSAAGLLEIAARHDTRGLLLGLALAGIGLGLFTPPNNATIMAAAPPGHAGVLSGVLNMTRGMGTALGVAIASALYLAAAAAGGASAAAGASRGLTVSLAALGALALGTGLALALARRRAGAAGTASLIAVAPPSTTSNTVPRKEVHSMTQSNRTQQLDRMVDDLCAEFAGQFGRREIETVIEDSARRISRTAKVQDFVPLMAYRFARERLGSLARAGQPHGDAGMRDIVFVSLSGGGRGQIAAALTSMLSRRQVSVHSAGTATHGQIDPAVSAVISELGVDTSEAFARPVTDEILRGADVVVTMGHSVGLIQIPPGVRHEDWRVGDPVGAPIDEVRRVRADIELRVRSLLESLEVPADVAAG